MLPRSALDSALKAISLTRETRPRARAVALAQIHGAANLLIFTERLGLHASNLLEVFDPSGRLSQRLP